MYGYGYPTGLYGAVPQMQDRLNQMEQAYQVPTVRGRIVTSIEEARAAQIPLDGTPSFFPSPAEKRVYEKSIGLDGMPIFKMYVLAEAKQPNLEARIAELEKAVSEIRREKDESNADDRTTPTIQ